VLQSRKLPPSSWHLYPTPDSESENVNCASLEPLGDCGPETIVGCGGGVVSTVQVYVLTLLSFPAGSTAIAFKLWLPSPRLPNVLGFEQAGKPCPSRLQWKLTVGSVSVKLKVALLELLGSGGPEMAGGGGAWVSTVHVYEVTSLSFISASTALTSNVWEPSARPEKVTPLEQSENPPPSS
jgi:hypothetical protein